MTGTAPQEAAGAVPDASPPRMAAGRRPDFIGIGAQKAGTTWLHANLAGHPAIWTPPVKELQYFNHLYIPGHRRWTDDHRRSHARAAVAGAVGAGTPDADGFRRIAVAADIASGPIGDAWYLGVFAAAPTRRLAGEITPEYALLPEEGVAHVRALCPWTRILFLMRDPFERTWSHVRMLAGKTDGAATPEDELLRIASYPDVLQRADYVETLDRWTAAFGEEQVFVGFFNEITERPEEMMARVCNFLRIDPDPALFPRMRRKVHEGAALAMPEAVAAHLLERLRPTYERIAARFPEIGGRWLAARYP